MVIGAQKAGTTWLHANLSEHPQVAFPPLKELFYFNEIDAEIPTNLLGRKINDHWLNIKWKAIIKEELRLAVQRGDFAKVKWFLRYLMIPRNLKTSSLDKYDRLFPAQPGRISGDITPNYSVLSEKTVRAVANYYPDCKIIFIMRNPVERSWSQAKMNLGLLKGQNIWNVPAHEIKAYLSSNRSNQQLSDYRTTIERWTAFYPKEQLFFGFYDALEKDPVSFYRSVLAFLKVEDTYDAEQLTRVVYQGVQMPMPAEYESILSAKYQEQLSYLANYFRDYPINFPQRWLEKAEHILCSPPKRA